MPHLKWKDKKYKKIRKEGYDENYDDDIDHHDTDDDNYQLSYAAGDAGDATMIVIIIHDA